MSKRGKLIAPKASVILSKIDDNNYDEKDVQKKAVGQLVTDSKQITSGYEYKGKVVAVGQGIDYIKEGDIVHHGIHSGALFSFDGENYITVPEYQFSAIETGVSESETNV